MAEDGYSKEFSDRFCAEIADGKSMKSICAQPGMPVKQTIFNWLRKYPEFAEAYRVATEERAESYVEEIMDIADDGTNDYYTDEDGKRRVDTEHINRSRLRVDTRKWYAGKVKPKKYGEKIAVGGAEDLPPVQVQKIERVLVAANKFVNADAADSDG
jgi:hypothetical protein